jgi:DNA-binding NtrC family response regulator
MGGPDALASRVVALAGESVLARAVRQAVLRAAADERHVLIVAEAGLDAEGVARLVHEAGPLAGAPCVVVDCAASDAASLEATLFGFVAPPRRRDGSAWRPAALERVGPEGGVYAARGGTLVLANIVESPAAVQGRLARLVRDGEMLAGERRRPVPFDVRLVATAPPTIEADVEEGRFRPDLFRRLATLRIDLPPLRQRVEDLPVIVARLLEECCRAAAVPPKHLTRAALAVLAALPWRGNLRELRTVLERIVTSVADQTVQVEQVLAHVRWQTPMVALRPNGPLREARRQFERAYVAAVLEQYGWRMSEAARALGVQRPNLYRKLRQLGLARLGLGRGRSKS